MSFLRRYRFFVPKQVVVCIFFLIATSVWADDVWSGPAFAASPEDLRQAAAAVKASKDADTTVLLDDIHFTYDRDGRVVESYHSIYRIENEEAVKGWAETSAHWEPWHQAKPEIRARVITVDGVVHTLDLKTLTDMPVHEDSPETYTDTRSFGGPLPAIAVGAIVEEEIVIRDTTLFFAAGTVQRLALDRAVPVNKVSIVLSHPESLALHYLLQQAPGARVKKSSKDGVETIEIEDGPYEANSEKLKYLPPDVAPEPQIEFATGTSWQHIAAEYARLSNDKLRSADVQLVLAKIDTRTGARLDVARRIVAALHKAVRYTGVEFGESSLVPQFPAETLKRKYGDCKDKAALLVAMLRAANIPADLALLSTGPGQDINTELPGMGMFDHAIVYVPATGTEPELWIDATAQYARLGVLPFMDYGRWALVVDEKTTELKKIPEFSAKQNLHRETRVFTMAEYGPAKIVEINEQIGPMEEDYRDFYTGDPKELRKNSEKYVKDTYLADSLASLEMTDISDLEKPFTVTYTSKGRRGFTDRENAVVYINQVALFDNLPDYFTTAEVKKKEADREKDTTPEKPRKADWQFNPFINEWHYKITAPPGFKLRALPPNKEEQLGTARFSQEYTVNQEGTVAEAVLRFDSGKARLTVDEARVLRDAVVKVLEADFIAITFDQRGYALLSAGKVKEALAVYQQLTALHPKEALHKTQLAHAYLTAGLGDRARAVAKEATVLEPNSPGVYNTLGWIMQHDLIGRRFAQGLDYQAGLDAYRKALQLDPKEVDPQNKGTRADYAILLEHDPEGVRYSPKAHMDLAISEFREIKKMDEESGKKYDDFVLYDLWYSGKFKELLEEAGKLPGSDIRRAFIIGSTAALQGPEAAIQKSLQITSEEQDRSKALVTAGFLLLRIRKYPESADLYFAGAHGQSESGRLLALAETLRKTKPYDQLKLPDSDPRSVVQEMVVRSLAGPFVPEENFKLFDPKALELYEKKDLLEQLRNSYNVGRNKITGSQLPVDVVLDIAISNSKYSVEGDDALGYHVTLQSPNAPAQMFFLTRQEGKYKILNFLGFMELGREAMEHLEKGDLAGARKWLDWARENVRLGGGDDPLDGPVFPRFWTKGQEADATAIRLSALSALAGTKYIQSHLPELLQARDKASDPAERARLNLVLAVAYQSKEQWADLFATAQELMKAYPESIRAYRMATTALTRMKKFDDWEQLLQERLKKHADEPEYLRSQATLALFRDNVSQSRAVLKGLIDSGKANTSDLNQFAWLALLPPAKVDHDAVEAAERANSLTQNADFSIMHTLACLYAEEGKTKEARELLLKAMDVAGLPEPNSAAWLALGQIAEQYGEADAARAMYARVEKADSEVPGSSYAMAQQRLAALKNAALTQARTVGK